LTYRPPSHRTLTEFMMNKQHRKHEIGSGFSKTRKNKTNDRSSLDGQRSINNTVQFIPRGVGLILPDRYRTNLRLWKSVSTSLSASNQASFRFSPSNAYDIDPVVASTSMSGFVELSTLYGRYRVLSSRCLVRVVNPSLITPLEITLCPVNLDPGPTPSNAYMNTLKEQPYAAFCTGGLAGSPVAKCQATMSTEKIFGSKMALFDDNFQSVVSASPTNNWWWVIALYASAVIPTNPIITMVTIDVDCEFFDRPVLQN
jgi:hypothetical protein